MNTFAIYNYLVMVVFSCLLYYVVIKYIIPKIRNIYIKLAFVFVMFEAYHYLWRSGPYFTVVNLISRF